MGYWDKITKEDLDGREKEILEEEKKEEALRQRWIEKYFNLPFEKRVSLLNSIITKYQSDSYKDRWYNRGIIPPTPFLSLFYDYAQKHGTKLEEDRDLYDDSYIVDGYKVSCYCGQGVVYSVKKL